MGSNRVLFDECDDPTAAGWAALALCIITDCSVRKSHEQLGIHINDGWGHSKRRWGANEPCDRNNFEGSGALRRSSPPT